MPNTINFFGLLTLEPVHFSAISSLAALASLAGVAGVLWAWIQDKRGKAFDHFALSSIRVEVGADGVKHLTIDNIGKVGRFVDEVRGRNLRRDVLAAAHRCSPQNPFLIMKTDARQEAMLGAILDGSTEMNQLGLAAYMAGLPYKVETIRFVVTASETDGTDETWKIRVSFLNDDVLTHLLDERAKWTFADAATRNRLEVLKRIAHAHFRNSGRIYHNKRPVRIVKSFRLTVPVYGANPQPQR